MGGEEKAVAGVWHGTRAAYVADIRYQPQALLTALKSEGRRADEDENIKISSINILSARISAAYAHQHQNRV